MLYVGGVGLSLRSPLNNHNMAKKDKTPQMPFNSVEWLTLPAVRNLPPDVRGLWIDMLCYMWESKERGVMAKPDGAIYTRNEIIRLVGVDSSGRESWLDQLIATGLCVVRDDGAFCSRKMLRQEQISAVRRKVGKKGGESTKAKILSAPIPTTRTPLAPDPPAEKEVAQEPADLFSGTEDVPETPPPLTPEQQAAADKKKKYKYAEFVTLTHIEYGKLCAEYGEEPTKVMIDILNNYKGSKGRKYKSDYLTIRGWVKDKYYEDLQKYGNKINGGAVTNAESSDSPAYRDTL